MVLRDERVGLRSRGISLCLLLFFCRGAALLRPTYAFAPLASRMVSQDCLPQAGFFQEGTTSVVPGSVGASGVLTPEASEAQPPRLDMPCALSLPGGIQVAYPKM